MKVFATVQCFHSAAFFLFFFAVFFFPLDGWDRVGATPSQIPYAVLHLCDHRLIPPPLFALPTSFHIIAISSVRFFSPICPLEPFQRWNLPFFFLFPFLLLLSTFPPTPVSNRAPSGDFETRPIASPTLSRSGARLLASRFPFRPSES